jgi:hypothetical protein
VTRTKIELVEEFQCPGCVAGSDTTCGVYDDAEYGCTAHVPGTTIMGSGGFITIALGLPKGFNRLPEFGSRHNQGELVRVHETAPVDFWNALNVPVWALEQNNVLFVRTYAPRVNRLWVDVIPGGKRSELCPQAIDVGEFYEDID